MAQPRISQLRTWERHVQLVLEILVRALALLKLKASTTDSETSLNRELYLCLLEANNEIYQSTGDAFGHAPTLEGRNPPDAEDSDRTLREQKIPDFYWGFIDHTAKNPRASARNFFIECKRLGKANRADWIFNENYINHGVRRFVEEKHGYAKGESTGGMVGYVQSMDFPEILVEVNKAAAAASLPGLEGPVGGWRIGGTSYLNHVLNRDFRISPFYLQHLWVDIRSA